MPAKSKKPVLAGMLNVPRAPLPLDDLAGPSQPARPSFEATGRATINMTVTPALKREFKVWCARAGISQVDAFKLGFDLLKGHQRMD